MLQKCGLAWTSSSVQECTQPHRTTLLCYFFYHYHLFLYLFQIRREQRTMVHNEVEDAVEEKYVPYQPPFLPPMPIDLTDEDENSDFSGSEDGHETGNDSDTEETSDENSSGNLPSTFSRFSVLTTEKQNHKVHLSIPTAHLTTKTMKRIHSLKIAFSPP